MDVLCCRVMCNNDAKRTEPLHPKFLQTIFQSLLAILLVLKCNQSVPKPIYGMPNCFLKAFVSSSKSISDVTIQTFKVGQIVVKTIFLFVKYLANKTIELV
jgi:hypothetical protein